MKGQHINKILVSLLLVSIFFSVLPPISALALSYEDPDTGATFELSKAWKEETLPSDVDDYFDAVFVHEDGYTLFYKAEDLWLTAKEAAASDLGITKRSDFNIDVLDVEDFKETFNASYAAKLHYNNVDWVKLIIPLGDDLSELECAQYITVQNGVCYSLVYYYPSDILEDYPAGAIHPALNSFSAPGMVERNKIHTTTTATTTATTQTTRASQNSVMLETSPVIQRRPRVESASQKNSPDSEYELIRGALYYLLIELLILAYPLFYMAQGRAETIKDIKHITLINALIMGVILVVIDFALSRNIIESIIIVAGEAFIGTFISRKILYRNLAAKQSKNHNLNLFKDQNSDGEN